jgi:hypothetical protein
MTKRIEGLSGAFAPPWQLSTRCMVGTMYACEALARDRLSALGVELA